MIDYKIGDWFVGKNNGVKFRLVKEECGKLVFECNEKKMLKRFEYGKKAFERFCDVKKCGGIK